MNICPRCGIDMDCTTAIPHNCTMINPIMPPSYTISTTHEEWTYDIKISDDNTKGEKKVTVHVRSDGDPAVAVALANKLFLEAKK